MRGGPAEAARLQFPSAFHVGVSAWTQWRRAMFIPTYMALLELSSAGLYCSAAQAHIDPWRGVDRAIITHGHSDHARAGSRCYLAQQQSLPILRARLGKIDAQGLNYGETVLLGDVRVSLHPAGHVLGSAQVRLEHRGEIWVVSGDYKTHADPTCARFEPVRCHGFVTEATFALPVYRWPAPEQVAAEIDAWWAENQTLGRTSVVFAYSLGKAQRALAMLPELRGPIFAHGAVLKMIDAYRAAGVALPSVELATAEAIRACKGKCLLIAPPSTDGSTWLQKFGPVSTAVASGWMRIRGARRRRNVDRGFILSDHADWDGLNSSVRATGAEQVWVTHGFTNPLARYLQDQGLQARPLETRFSSAGEETDESNSSADPQAAIPDGQNY